MDTLALLLLLQLSRVYLGVALTRAPSAPPWLADGSSHRKGRLEGPRLLHRRPGGALPLFLTVGRFDGGLESWSTLVLLSLGQQEGRVPPVQRSRGGTGGSGKQQGGEWCHNRQHHGDGRLIHNAFGTMIGSGRRAAVSSPFSCASPAAPPILHSLFRGDSGTCCISSHSDE